MEELFTIDNVIAAVIEFKSAEENKKLQKQKNFTEHRFWKNSASENKKNINSVRWNSFHISLMRLTAWQGREKQVFILNGEKSKKLHIISAVQIGFVAPIILNHFWKKWDIKL